MFLSFVVYFQCLMAHASLFFFFWWLSNSFLSATWPVKPASQSPLSTVEIEIVLPQPLLNFKWSCCPVSAYHTSCWLSEMCPLILLWLWIYQTSSCQCSPNAFKSFLMVYETVQYWTISFWNVHYVLSLVTYLSLISGSGPLTFSTKLCIGLEPLEF